MQRINVLRRSAMGFDKFEDWQFGIFLYQRPLGAQLTLKAGQFEF
jgi:hypothetical protein